VAEPEQILSTIDAYAKTFTAHDRDGWLALWCEDATQEDPVGAPVNTGPEAIGLFWDNTHALGDLRLEATDEPIVVGDEALAFFRVDIGHGADRLSAPRIVDHMHFADDGRIQSLRAFWDPATLGPSPE